MLSLSTRIHQIAGPLVTSLICIVLFIFEPQSSQLLVFERTLVQQGEWWRLLSGNWLHTNLYHLLLNLAGIILLWALHGDYYRTAHYFYTLIICCIGCTLGILFFSAELIWYVGMSGALHGLFVCGAVLDIKEGLKTGWLLLGGIFGKVFMEQIQGPSEQVSQLIQAQVAIDAHLYGTLTGAVLIAVVIAFIQLQKKMPKLDS